MPTLSTDRFELVAISYSTLEVGTYCDHLQMRYLTITDMKELCISSVNLIKEKANSVEHEYISVTVQDRNKRVSYICFERNRGDECREAQIARGQRLGHYGMDSSWRMGLSSSPSFHLDRNTSSPSSLFSIASLDSTKNTCRAQDVVTLTVDTLKHPFDTVTRVLKCRRDMEPLYLYELAVLAKTLHNASNEYKLFSRNCYWYAGVLFELLEQRLKANSTLGEHRNGVWGRISIYRHESPRDLAKVMEQFVRNLAAFEHEIRERENSQKQHRETERENVKLKQEVQRLKNKESIQERFQPSASVSEQHDRTSEVLHLKEIEQRVSEAVQQEKEARQLAEEKIEENQHRIEEERQWKREERHLKEEERRLKEEERRLKELAEQRAIEAERANEEKDKKLKLMEERLEGLQPLLELLPGLRPERYSVAGLSTA